MVANGVTTPGSRVQGVANWAKTFYKYLTFSEQLILS